MERHTPRSRPRECAYDRGGGGHERRVSESTGSRLTS
jgi:hypothetical protein